MFDLQMFMNFFQNLAREKQGYYMMIKGSVHQEDMTNENIGTHIGALKYIKKILC